MILTNGDVAAIWRPQKTGKRLRITVLPLASLPKKTRAERAEIEAKAELLVPFRLCTTVEIEFASSP